MTMCTELGSREADTGRPSPRMPLSGREDRCMDGLGGDEPLLREPEPCQEESRKGSLRKYHLPIYI